MIIKGLISAIYKEDERISVILPEYHMLTTKPLKIYGSPNMDNFKVNDFVAVIVFNDNFNDGMVLPRSVTPIVEAGLPYRGETTEDMTIANLKQGIYVYNKGLEDMAPSGIADPEEFGANDVIVALDCGIRFYVDNNNERFFIYGVSGIWHKIMTEFV